MLKNHIYLFRCNFHPIRRSPLGFFQHQIPSRMFHPKSDHQFHIHYQQTPIEFSIPDRSVDAIPPDMHLMQFPNHKACRRFHNLKDRCHNTNYFRIRD